MTYVGVSFLFAQRRTRHLVRVDWRFFQDSYFSQVISYYLSSSYRETIIIGSYCVVSLPTIGEGQGFFAFHSYYIYIRSWFYVSFFYKFVSYRLFFLRFHRGVCCVHGRFCFLRFFMCFCVGQFSGAYSYFQRIFGRSVV